MTQPVGARRPNRRGDQRAKSRPLAGKQEAGAYSQQEPGSVGSTPVAAEIISQGLLSKSTPPAQGSSGGACREIRCNTPRLEATGQKWPHPSTEGTKARENKSFLSSFIKLVTEQTLCKYGFSEYI